MTDWQDISTAPRDGETIDLWCAPLDENGYRLTPCRIPNCYWVPEFRNWYAAATSGESIRIWHRVTHWMPLPPAPTVLESE